MNEKQEEISKLTIAFDLSKNCQFTPNQGFKTLQRRLKSSGFKVILNKDEINPDILSQIDLLIISTPQETYTETELNNMKKFINNGGKLWIMLGEGGEKRYQTNINNFLQNYGIKINNDSVIRTSYYKYFHPKEALITNGVINRGLITKANSLRINSSNSDSLSYVYPFGATLNCNKPSIPVLSTGSVCYPLNRPTISFFINSNGGKLIVSGSSQMFTDTYLEKEDNSLLKDLFIDFFINTQFQLNQIDAKNPEILDYHLVPDLSLLSEEPFSCLQESEDVPSDYNKLFSRDLYHVDNISLASIIQAYQEFNMEREPLRLIKPQFEAPLPKLEPAVFPPKLRAITKPNLELFDLDEALSSIPKRLTQIATKCTDNDLDYYIKECGIILGIPDAANLDSKHILEYIFDKIVYYKKVNV